MPAVAAGVRRSFLAWTGCRVFDKLALEQDSDGGEQPGVSSVFYWIYDYPTWSMGALFAAVFVAVTWLGIFVLRPTVVS